MDTFSLEDLYGTWEATKVSLGETDKDSATLVGEYYEDTEDCENKPYSRGKFIKGLLGFTDEKVYSYFEIAEAMYNYTNPFYDENDNVDCDDVDGKVLGEEVIEIGSDYETYGGEIEIEDSSFIITTLYMDDNGDTDTHKTKIVFISSTSVDYYYEELGEFYYSGTLTKISDTVDVTDFPE